jgi:hypothetical protein
MKADIIIENRAELVSIMEPLLIGEGSRHRAPLTDLALDLSQKSAGLRRSLPPALLTSLADLVRAMNCYYSNLIEGHDTHPVDIERALKNDYSKDARKRDLQFEARAHIAVQQWIDRGGLNGGMAIKPEGLRDIHRRFCELLPDELRWVEDPATKKRIRLVPGELRLTDARSAGTSPSVPAQSHAFWSASRRSMARSAKWNPSSPSLPLTTGSCGYIRS